jgi:hypothetical protein
MHNQLKPPVIESQTFMVRIPIGMRTTGYLRINEGQTLSIYTSTHSEGGAEQNCSPELATIRLTT